MKHSEPDYLDTLFALSSDETDAAERGFPLVEVPDTLNDKLTAIVQSAPVKRQFLASWPTVTSIAATLLVTLVGLQFYQQQQTLNQLEQAQADLSTALHYLGEANRITRAQVVNTLNDSVSDEMTNARVHARTNANAWLETLETLQTLEKLETLEPEIKTPNRSL